MNQRGILDYYARPGLRELAFLVPPLNLWRIRAIRAILSALRTDETGPILEIACASGVLTRRLARKFPGTPIQAIDISEPMIRSARAATHEPNVTYRAVDLFDLRESYPLVLGMHILHMVPLDPFVDKLREIVPPGGRTVQSFTCVNPLTRLYRRFYRVSRGEDVHLARPESIVALFGERGFDTSLQSIDYWENSWLLRAERRE
jgi:cyclopropane fatty-acyl-phospholipid synthase-like methyltransferase